MYITTASFVISSSNESLSDLTSIIGITPTMIRDKSEFPCSDIAHSEWCISLGEGLWKTISEPMNILNEILFKKIECINQAVKTVNGQTSFVIVIHSDSDELPELVLSTQLISFIGLLNAELCFDIYTNESVTH